MLHFEVRPLTKLLLLIALAACGRPAEWQTLTADDASFRIELPGAPKRVRQALGTPAGEAPVQMWMLQPDADHAFMVGYTELPAELGAQIGPEELLASARDGAVERVRGKLLRDEPRALGSVRGRRIELEAEAGRVRVRGDLFVDGRRLYQVLATVLPEEVDSPDVRRFLDSFVLLPSAEAILTPE